MQTPVLTHTVQCAKCKATAVVQMNQHVHDALVCGCCPVQHNHGEAANQSGVACRPITVRPFAAVVLVEQ